MKSLTTLSNLFQSLSQNTSTDNIALGKQQISDSHRYLLQKYFSNETSFTTSTIGEETLTLTTPLFANATNATLTSPWALQSVQQLVNFSNADQRLVTFTNGSASISWSVGLQSSATNQIQTVGVQGYNIPFNYSKMKDVTINVGQLKFLPTEINTRQEWDNVNFLPYSSDIPRYYFIYNGIINIFPIPSTTGNVITINYKLRVPDLTIDDVTNQGTISVNIGSTAVTGVATTWQPTRGTSELRWLRIDFPDGDEMWYQIQSVNSTTSITLVNPYNGTANVSGSATYTIGQMPLIIEDFQDMLVYRPLYIYYSSINSDSEKASRFKALWDEGIALLDDYSGSKSVNVDLGQTPQQINPNLFIYGN